METNVHWRTALHMPYLSGEEIELGKEFVLTVERFEEVEVYDQSTKKKELKVVVYFVGAKKGLILSPRKNKAITFCMGSGVLDHWIGRKITLYSKMEKHFGQEMPVINIKLIRNENK